MPKAGDCYEITLKEPHLNWGSYRHTSTRGVVYGEGYIQIPAQYAHSFDIYNSNMLGHSNLYLCSSSDGFLNQVSVKASGSKRKGDPYAKQFQGAGDLRVFGDWFFHVNAQPGDAVKVSWLTSKHFIIEKI